jgi:hypothetical protein
MQKMMDNRADNAGEGSKDSDDSIRRAGGEDPRRYDAKIAIDRAVTMHDQSGYNHNATSVQPANGGNENIAWAHSQDRKSAAMGNANPDGTQS